MTRHRIEVDYEALATFRYALRRFLRFSERAARAVRLTPQQHQALLAICGFPGDGRATVGDLAERLQVRHHSAVGLVDRLQRKGLVQRGLAGGDRRRVQISLTARGRRLLARLSAMHHAEITRVAPELQAALTRLAGRAR